MFHKKKHTLTQNDPPPSQRMHNKNPEQSRSYVRSHASQWNRPRVITDVDRRPSSHVVDIFGIVSSTPISGVA